jgi:hypothetical protein
MMKKQSAAMVTKEIFLLPRRGPKTVLCATKYPYLSAVFTTALLGLAPARSARASAANHRK